MKAKAPLLIAPGGWLRVDVEIVTSVYCLA